MLPVRKDLQLYKKVEKNLKSFFRLFDDLCLYCFNESIDYLRGGGRDNYDELCCCITDNQVHDHWPYLNSIQKITNGLQWLAKMDKTGLEIGRHRLPGNGPCPALCESGCVIKRFRPPTCSTQLCRKMIFILHELNTIDRLPKCIPCQIEDIVGIQSPMDLLYGIKKGKPDENEIDVFIEAIRQLALRMSAVKIDVRKIAIEKQKSLLSSKLERRRR